MVFVPLNLLSPLQEGKTALQWAQEEGHTEVVSLLQVHFPIPAAHPPFQAPPQYTCTHTKAEEQLRACMAPPLNPTDVAWLTERAQGGVLTTPFLNWDSFAHALNWALAAREAGVTYAFICLDEKSKNRLEDSGERCVQASSGILNYKSCIWAVRARILRQLTESGVDVLLTRTGYTGDLARVKALV